ncbi:hypothetical protein NQ314_013601 [Rhamnusium bicolor]|uniref:DDE-1 domain-containing protein n=1 Tax=Rhamnusium bicolor TaxID=1586634 RepID=A0AAV8X539_9CUCU|nr:hypothetical protein NQ314_013601 [Rhamnusium bicolor]
MNSFHDVAAHYSVPRSVIGHRITERKTSLEVLRQGIPPALDKDIENQLAALILARADFGYPMDKKEFYDFVKDFCQDRNVKTPFKERTPGQDWYANFMKRHPQLSLKKTQSLQNKRAEASDPFVVGNHYKNLKRIVEENEFDQYPELFFNCDEFGFCTDPSKIGVKNKALYQRIRGTGRENISINCCVSADGSALPPHIIFQGCAVLPRWTGVGEDLSGIVYAASPKGSMEEPVFYSWFADHFISYVNKIRETLIVACQNQKAILMYHGHRSHVSSRLVQTALENNIIHV